MICAYYLPEKCGPHCTVANRLSEESRVQAFGYCRNIIN
jgi:hypothetical protein